MIIECSYREQGGLQYWTCVPYVLSTMIDILRINPYVPSILSHMLFIPIAAKGFPHVKRILGLVCSSRIVAVIVDYSSVDGIPVMEDYINRAARTIVRFPGLQHLPHAFVKIYGSLVSLPHKQVHKPRILLLTASL